MFCGPFDAWKRRARIGATFMIAATLLPSLGLAAAMPEPPRLFVDTSTVTPTGRTIAVAAGGDVQAALDTAQPGDVITLAAGATFVGNFTLPNKNGTGWITIRSSAPDASLPPAGTRITPADAAALPKLASPNANPAISTAPGAHHFRLVALEVTVGAGVTSNNGLVLLGTGVQTTLAEVPHDLVIERLYIHGNATVRLRRNVTLNSAWTAVIDSYLSDAHDPTYDTQAACGWNGPGPFKIVNNYLEAAGENLMFGGGDPAIPGLVPSDIEIRRNHFFKPLSWRVGDPSYGGVHWAVKNLLELKNAQRVLIDGNVLEHNWADAQSGMAVLFTVRNQDGGAPWSVVQDVTFTKNVVRHAAGGVHILGLDDLHPSQRTSRVLVSNNLFDDIDGTRWGGRGRLLLVLNGSADVVIEHITALQSGDLLGTDWAPNTGFVFRDNIAADNGYGVVADRGSLAALAMYFPDAQFFDNALPGGRATDYPAGNSFPPTVADVGFNDPAAGDYRLSAVSPYRLAGTDGKDLGADVDALEQAIIAVVGTADPGAPPSGADLVPTAVTDPPAFLAPGGKFAVTVTVQNRGDAASSGSYTRFYLSKDRSSSSTDVRLSGSSSVASLAERASITKTATVTVPSKTPLASYFLLACADDTNTTVETDERNNCLASTTMLAMTRPDLVTTAVSDPPVSALRGGTFTLRDTVDNQGAVAAKASRTRHYLSLDQRKDAADRLLTGSRLVPTLAAGASSTGTVSVTVPSTVAAATYYVITCADDTRAAIELDEANNCRVSARPVVVQ